MHCNQVVECIPEVFFGKFIQDLPNRVRLHALQPGFEISADNVSAHWAPYLWNVSAHSKNEGAQTNIFCLGKTFEYFKELN